MRYRNADQVIQCMALRLVAAVVGGLGASDRGVAAVHADALKVVDKCLRDKSASTAVKTAAAAVIKAVAEAGGAGLWANAGSAFDDTARLCVSGLVDPSQSEKLLQQPWVKLQLQAKLCQLRKRCVCSCPFYLQSQ